MILLLAGEWYAAFSVIGAVLVAAAGWKPFKRMRERAKVRQRLRELTRP